MHQENKIIHTASISKIKTMMLKKAPLKIQPTAIQLLPSAVSLVTVIGTDHQLIMMIHVDHSLPISLLYM